MIMKMHKELKTTEGIVLKSLDYKENAQIAYFYGHLGRFNVLVRGSKKIGGKSSAFCETLTLASVNHTDAEFSSFSGGDIIDSYTEIKNDFVKTQVAMCMIDKIYHLNESITNHETCYKFLKECLDYLKKTKYPQLLLVYFEIKLTYLLGIHPEFKKCIYCGSLDELSFSIIDGGCLCDKHQYETIIDLDVYELAYLKALYYTKIGDLKEELLEELGKKENYLSQLSKYNQIIDKYYQRYIEYLPNSKKIYYTLCK